MPPSPTPVISDFLKRYDTSVYQKLAKKAEEICRHYREPKDIRKDIVDFAGVRIALYMPPHKAQIDYLIRTTFELRETVDHPGAQEHPEPASDRMYLGYQAKHYRVKLIESQLEGLEEFFGNLQEPVVEIQVVSILHHVWANAQHDIEYKSLGGAPSDDELRMLDLLNGLMQFGERHLDKLHDINFKRIESQDKPFANKWELGSWLFNWLSRIMTPEDVNLGPIEVLRRFVSLPLVRTDTPNKLEVVLKEMRLGGPLTPSLQDISCRLGSGETRETRASILIIAHITHTRFPRSKSQHVFAVAKPQPAHEQKLKEMASSFIWLFDLFPPTSRWSHSVAEYAISKKRQPAIKWLLTTVTARQIMAGETRCSDAFKRTVDELWVWMEASHIDSLCLAFSISKSGACRLFPNEDEFTKLTGVYGILQKLF